ncbi:hypothetical protein JCM19239_2784 [Vibrio variabilis]|uniref:Mobile element protein n=1 Tax=Vibrio variabilis TaxID=990271 RepID=A0ABQ0JPZ5_9VIBR|nr:hypothetical protein JCM19239_2784 [Vibrio variabilis]
MKELLKMKRQIWKAGTYKREYNRLSKYVLTTLSEASPRMH